MQTANEPARVRETESQRAPDIEHGRERRKRETRQSLRAATLRLGLEQPLAEVPVEAIAAAAGVSTRTFFNYFDTKEDAALLDLFGHADAHLDAVAASDASGLWADLADLFVADATLAQAAGLDLPSYLRLHATNPAVSSRQLARFAAFEGRLAQAIADRLPATTEAATQARLMSGCCITAVRVGLGEWASGDTALPVERPLRRAFALLAPAFAGPHSSSQDQS